MYAGRKTLVVGSGHSAANALLEVAALAEIDPRTSLLWATRSSNLARIFSGGDTDQLPARGELGADVRALVDSARVSLMTGFAVVALHEAIEQARAFAARLPLLMDQGPFSIQLDVILVRRRYRADRSVRARRR